MRCTDISGKNIGTRNKIPGNILSMEALQNIYQLVTTNLKYAREQM